MKNITGCPALKTGVMCYPGCRDAVDLGESRLCQRDGKRTTVPSQSLMHRSDSEALGLCLPCLECGERVPATHRRVYKWLNIPTSELVCNQQVGGPGKALDSYIKLDHREA